MLEKNNSFSQNQPLALRHSSASRHNLEVQHQIPSHKTNLRSYVTFGLTSFPIRKQRYKLKYYPTMISAFTRRILLNSNADSLIAKQVRLVSSMTPREKAKQKRRNIHTTPIRKADATAEGDAVEVKKTSAILDRFTTTAEVTISKIFPAGFGWQSASILAENSFGYAPDTAAFALTTGVGDAVGVLIGHVSYHAAKKSLYDGEINMSKEVQTGLLLGTAAFCSGTVWQPLVDLFQGANLSFMQVFAGTWVGCGTAFYVGLRAGRTIFGGYLEHIEEPTFENAMDDKSLSAAIGGATGFFVGTDAAYMPTQNFLIDIVGIKASTPDLVGCAIAGSSTALGFVSAQSAFNIVYPVGKLWND